MTQYLHPVSAWWITHPLWVGFIYFCAAVLITLFTDRVRRLVFAPVTYSAKGMLFLMNREMTSRVRAIRYVDKNPFNLVVYVCYYWVDAFIWTFWESLAIWAFVAFLIDRPTHAPPGSVFPIAFGMLLGKCIMFKRFIRGFFDPDKTIKELEELMANPAKTSPQASQRSPN